MGLKALRPFVQADTSRALAWVITGEPYRETGDRAYRSSDEDDGVLDDPLIWSLMKRSVWGMAHGIAGTPLTLIERSPVRGTTLATVTGAGAAALATDLADKPILLAYAFGALIVVRVADPVLAAVGDELAGKVRRLIGGQADPKVAGQLPSGDGSPEGGDETPG